MLSVVIPCYNEAETLAVSWPRLHQASLEWDEPCEFIFVDDGSRDETWQVIRQLVGQDERARGVRLLTNQGQQWAIGIGLQEARGDAVVVLDADLQDPPELINDMLAAWRNGADMVIAVRRQRQREVWWKRLGARLVYGRLWQLGSGRSLPDAGDFVLLDRKVVRWLLRWRMLRPFWRGMRECGTFRRAYMEYDRRPRIAGKSHYSLRRLLRLAWDGFFGVTEIPARLAVWLLCGLLLACAALVLACARANAPGLVAAICMSAFLLVGGQLALLAVTVLRAVRLFEIPPDAWIVERTDSAVSERTSAPVVYAPAQRIRARATGKKSCHGDRRKKTRYDKE